MDIDIVLEHIPVADKSRDIPKYECFTSVCSSTPRYLAFNASITPAKAFLFLQVTSRSFDPTVKAASFLWVRHEP